MRARRSGESALLLLDAIDVLSRGGVSYAVIGAMAASVHGVVRASMDADAVLSLATHALTQMEHQFREAGFRTELRLGDEDDPIAAVLALTDDQHVVLQLELRLVQDQPPAGTVDPELEGAADLHA